MRVGQKKEDFVSGNSQVIMFSSCKMEQIQEGGWDLRI